MKEDGTGGRSDPRDDGSEEYAGVDKASITLGDSGNVTLDKDGNLTGAVDFNLGENVNIQINTDTDLDDKSAGNFWSNINESIKNILFTYTGDKPSAALGGWISGPQSGYGVSLDGGRSTSFIGHGTEYVARKSDGGAFVVPFDTPGTKTQPNLTNKRLGEAKSM